MFTAPDSTYFSILGFPIYYYGIILAFSVFIGFLLADYTAEKKYFFAGLIPNIAVSVILGGIIGARIYYCLLNYEFYYKNPLEILDFRSGGLSVHGALLGGAAVLYYQSKRNRQEFLKLCDIFALSLPLAQSIGRWGNFINSEAYGLPTNLPWKLYIKEQYRPEKYLSSSYFHPAFLYESLLDIILFFILYFAVMPKNKENPGIISAWYLILYSIIRIGMEFIRIDCVKYVFNQPFPVIISFILIIFSSLFIIIKSTNR